MDDFYNEVISVIEENVKCERELVELILHVAVSAWTPHPLNLILRGAPSTGKTYTVVNTVKVLPKDAVWILGGLSPMALVHERGELVDEGGVPIAPIEKTASPAEKEIYRERLKNARFKINLRNKVLVFLEAPRKETFDMLRPILSHDEEMISYKFVDKVGGKLKTMHVVIEGWPATIFCSSDAPWLHEFVSRCITANPKEEDEEKFREAHRVTARRYYDPTKETEINEKIRRVREYLSAKLGGVTKAVIPYAGKLAELFPAGREEMRFFRHFLSLIETHTIFGSHKVIDIYGEKYNVATLDDLTVAVRIWSYNYATTKTGLSRTALEILNLLSDTPKTARMIYEEMKQKGHNISMKTIYTYMSLLVEAGFAEVSTNPEDRRSRVYTLVEKPENSLISSNRIFPGLFGEKELREWLKNILLKTQRIYIDGRMRGEDEAISILAPLYIPRGSEEYFSSQEKASQAEQSPEKFYQKKLEDFKEKWVKIGSLERFSICEFCGSGTGFFRVKNESGEVRIACSLCYDSFRFRKPVEG